jgi:hypothetical protein
MNIHHSLSLAFLTLLGSGAWAQNTGKPIETAPNWSLSAEAGRASYHARETGPAGQTLNAETGHLQLERLGLTYQVNGRWKLKATVESLHDTVAYDGVTQNAIPLHTHTRIRLNRYEGHAQYAWLQSSDYQVYWIAGLEHLTLDRAIAGTLPAPPLLPFGTQPLTETLHSTRAILGSLVSWAPSASLPVTLDLKVELLPAIAHRLDVNTFGTYDNKKLRPHTGLDWRVGLHFQYQIKPDLKLTLAQDAESLSPRASGTETLTQSGTPVATVTYPGSKQYLRSTRIGAVWSF